MHLRLEVLSVLFTDVFQVLKIMSGIQQVFNKYSLNEQINTKNKLL